MGLLANMCRAITDNGANIITAHAKTSESGKAENTFEIIITSADHLNRVKRSIERVPGVLQVIRITSLDEEERGIK
jgi:(p)ppGpp synthase/HD superfamily hydrolase